MSFKNFGFILKFIQSPKVIKLAYLFISASLLVRGLVFLDPDFGWHYRSGELILTSGFPTTDPFSYTMPLFKYVDHAWLTDIFIALLYPLLGYTFLAVIFSVIPFVSVFLIYKRFSKDLNKNGLWQFSGTLLLLTGAIVLPFSGVRTQVVSWFYFTILFLLCAKDIYWKRLRWGIPLVFILWANMHGSFVSGYLLLGIYIFIKTVKRTTDRYDYLVLLISLLVWIINPYGVLLLREVRDTLGSTVLRENISEWRPGLYSLNISQVILLPLTLGFLVKYSKKYDPFVTILWLVFLFQMLFAVRHQPLWALISLYIGFQGVLFLYKEIAKNKEAGRRFVIASNILLVCTLVASLAHTFLTLRTSRLISESYYYPRDAVNYLKNNIPQGNIISEYGWGGYLIWKLPEKKTFIDGRMAVWKEDDSLPGQTKSAMIDHLELGNGKTHIKTFVEKYDVDTVLWSQGDDLPEDNLLKLILTLVPSLNVFPKESFGLVKDLERNNWKRVYEDNRSIILCRPDRCLE